jgi:tetratricopeptide (TPR) repeat protein
MSRAWKFSIVLTAAVAVGQTVAFINAPVRANGSSMPSAGGGGSSMPAPTPEQMARDAYNSGIGHKDKGLKYETDAVKQAAKDQEKTLAKAKDEYGKALKDFEKATKLVPDLYQAYNGLGYAYRKTGDYAKALENYDKALALAPGFADALEYRGEAYLGLNHVDDAKQAYLDLFAKDRAQADQLMTAMAAWVAKHQANPAGVDPAVVSALDGWIKERTKVATLTANMGLTNHESIWK